MTGKIFKNMVLVSTLVFALCVTIFMGTMYEYFESRVYNELESEAILAAQGEASGGEKFFSALELSNRLTWIAADGTVLYDSAADAGTMENHGNREEFQEALTNGSGKSEHYSDIYLEKTLYYALQAADGTVVRLSCTQNTVLTLLLGMIGPILWVFLLALICSGALASHLSRKITKPLNEISLDHPEESGVYPELKPMVQRLNEQNRTIHRQMDELSRKQREFNAITENMQEGFILLDQRGAILSSNHSAERFFRQENRKELRLNASAELKQAAEAALTGQHSEQLLEQNGRIYQLVSNPVIVSGQVNGGVLFLIDVTEKEQREQLRREFTANVSHELKTPLTSISGFAELMKDGLVPPDKMKEFAGDIYRESHRLTDLVGDILKLSKLDEGSTYPEEPVDLYDLSMEIADRLAPEAVRHGIHISVTGQHCAVQGARQILDEMIYNLCDNAIKYNVSGGTVKVHIERAGSKTKLSVADTGIGIPYGDQNRVFERFYRVDKSHSKEVGGTGLGLSIVKHAAQYHNAELRMESTPGKGTTITIIFPEKL